MTKNGSNGLGVCAEVPKLTHLVTPFSLRVPLELDLLAKNQNEKPPQLPLKLLLSPPTTCLFKGALLSTWANADMYR